jgi:hypothetical protein
MASTGPPCGETSSSITGGTAAMAEPMLGM